MEIGKDMVEDVDMFLEKERLYGKMDVNINRGENNILFLSLFKVRINKDLY